MYQLVYITVGSIIESFQGFHGCALRKLMSELEHPKSFRMLYNDSLVVWPSGQRLQQHTTYTFTPSHAEFHILDHGARVNCVFVWCELWSQSSCWDNPRNKLGFPWNWSDSKQFLRSDWIHFDVYSVVFLCSWFFFCTSLNLMSALVLTLEQIGWFASFLSMAMAQARLLWMFSGWHCMIDATVSRDGVVDNY